MKLILSLVLLAGVAFGLPSTVRAADTTSAPKKVLFLSKSSGFIHPAIMPENGETSKNSDGPNGFAFPVLREIGEENNIEFTFSKDGSLVTPEYLAQFDAFCFSRAAI